jgi:hypothetical protein
MAKDKPSRSRELASKVIFAAFNILKEKGGQAPGREVVAEVEKRAELDDWAKTIYEKSGYVRWQSMLHFFSIDCIKAGFLVKKKEYGISLQKERMPSNWGMSKCSILLLLPTRFGAIKEKLPNLRKMNKM